MSEIHQNKETDQLGTERQIDSKHGKWVNVFDKGGELEKKDSKSPWLEIPVNKSDKNEHKDTAKPWLNIFKKAENSSVNNKEASKPSEEGKINDENKEKNSETSYPPNSTIDVNGQKCKTDDTGKIYFRDGKLEPNCEYTLNGNKYKTDALVRIINAKGDVKLPTEDRKNLPDMDNPDKRDTDDKGHVIGHQIGGADTEGNLVPQDATFNRGEYNKLEQELAKLKVEGHDVKIDVKLVYEGDSKRPSKFIVKYTVDGKTYIKTFINEADQTGGQNG
ncbi:DNA/RNA non-specific endonuclease [Treponema sp.]|uniref:DNA/RNA non-specific endonuclease n=1 Tax=Treponema sp. TaxID=166 RepID=UPI003FD827D7